MEKESIEYNKKDYYIVSVPSNLFSTFEMLEEREALWAPFLGNSVVLKITKEDRTMFKLSGKRFAPAETVTDTVWKRLKPFTRERCEQYLEKIEKQNGKVD